MIHLPAGGDSVRQVNFELQNAFAHLVARHKRKRAQWDRQVMISQLSISLLCRDFCHVPWPTFFLSHIRVCLKRKYVWLKKNFKKNRVQYIKLFFFHFSFNLNFKILFLLLFSYLPNFVE